MKIKKDAEKVFYKKGDIYQYSSGVYEDRVDWYNIVKKDFEKMREIIGLQLK